MKPVIDANRWAAVLAAFDEIVELDAPTRAARLAAIGADDAELRRAIEAVLAADTQAASRLARLDRALGSSDARPRDHRRDPDPLELVGRTVSHFRIIEPLAQGGMGIVYRAEDTRLGRPVALKFPLAVHDLDARAKERFLHEAQLAGALDHPNLCAIYEAGETDDGHLFHAMPLYGGETLRARLARDGALPIADALGIAKQIAHGLSAAHGAGIVHRDLKPANVMLLPDGTVKILDFGLARAKDLSLTASRAALGTVSYMAPEQIVGRSLDARADLWALGVVLYEMLSGARPFEGDDVGAITHAIVHGEPAPLPASGNEITRDLQGVVRTLLEKNPDRRYPSAEDVATVLALIQVGRPALPAMPSRSGARSTWRGRSSSRVAMVAVSVTALLALGGGAWVLGKRGAGSVAPVSVRVQPFAIEGDTGDVRHIAAGLSEAIGAELARVHGVIVAAASEADAVVTGTVRRSGDRLLVDVRLADVGSNQPRWTERYDRSRVDVVDVQSSAIRSIVAEMDVELTDAERARLDRPFTSSAQAYDLYLRGRDAELRGVSLDIPARIRADNVRLAVSFYSQARALDPSFAVARGRLALMLMRAAGTYDSTSARREQARLEAETALRLDPGLPEAHSALGSYWSWGGRDLTKAIEQWTQALVGAPHRAEVHLRLADAYVRAARWEDAVAAYERAMQVEPQNQQAAVQAAFTYTRLRRNEAAMRAYDRAIALDPDDHMVRVIKGHTYLRWHGTTDTLAAVMRSVPAGWDPAGMATWARYTMLRSDRRYADAIAMLDSSKSTLSRDGLVYQLTAFMRAQSYEALGEHAKARVQYEMARAMLADSVAAHPASSSIRAAYGLVLAALGRRGDAVREARRAMELAPLAQVSPIATAAMGVAVEVFARAGELDTAFELLELLFAMPAGREATTSFLRVWPGFDPLRKDPRFDQLLARFPES